jgi:glycosyltransferase involved in cell wall biosynthesis
MDEDMYRLSLSPGRVAAKLIAMLRAVFRRINAVRRWREYDVLYLQRELLPVGPPMIERWLRRKGASMLFDYDDALFIKKASVFNPLATMFRSPNKTREMFRIVDCTIAGNDWLRDAAIAEGGRAETLEVAEDASRFTTLPRSITDFVTIGWLGSPSTIKYLRLIENALRRVAAKHQNVKWEVMGGGDFQMVGIAWQSHDWSLSEETKALERYDIGLMPLPDETWALGKSGGKARTYMAAGVVPVVSAIGYNLELIEHGRTGFLCQSDDDWVTALDTLIGDASLRRQVGLLARAEVEQRFSPSDQAARLANIIRRTSSGKSRRR